MEKVRDRLVRATAALERAGLPYAVVKGNAVYLWVETHGEGGERNTPNVDLLVNRAELSSLGTALEGAGFFSDPARPDLYQDGPNGSPKTRIRLLFARKKVCEADLLANPAITCVERIGAFQVLDLPALVQTKLIAYRTIDKVHLRDMLDMEMIDETWKDRYPPELADGLQLLIDTPEG